jgi:hypothetical protein
VSNIEKLKDKVAKLLRQAEDVAGTPEEAVFQSKAFELMAKYGISEAAVDAAMRGLDVSDLREAIVWRVKIEGKYANAQMLLLHNITLALHGKTVYVKNPSDGALYMTVYAVQAHQDRIQMLWNILQPQMMRLVDKVRPDYDISRTKRRYNYVTHEFEYYKSAGTGELKSYRRSWIAGFGSSVGERLRLQETQALAAADAGSALVLFTGDKEKAELALRQAHPRLRTQRSARVDPNGYAHGQRDGSNAAFNHSLSR